ncbi:hypothetical protein [Leptospira phage LE3]|uniref:Uncharacterized protein n=2 Tax=Nylescharonvirus TaxID=2843431 RepID=A0A343LEH6_9CAUD|nr:hypothetical protein HWB33_gp75 [Leptospira phage LE3]YP_009835548.1 hypothetical protein HWB34_gp73 [Leptospira phage LE4]ATN95002.1 hypothetical protein [Leptospira phage LE3]ATN95086.1 hypothetical protein [Leptospira phage LE4]
MEIPEIYEKDKNQYKNFDEAIHNANRRASVLQNGAFKSLTGRDFMALEILKVMIQSNLKINSEIYRDAIYVSEQMIRELYPVLKKNKKINVFWNSGKEKYISAKSEETKNKLTNDPAWQNVTDDKKHLEKIEPLLWENV